MLEADLSQAPQGSDPTTVLEQTRRMIQARATAYGANDVKVESSPPKGIVVSLTGVETADARRLATARGVVDFRRPVVTPDGLVACKTQDGQAFGVPPNNVNPDSASGSHARCFSLDKLGDPAWQPAELLSPDGSRRRLTSDMIVTGGWQERTDLSSPAITVQFNDNGTKLLDDLTSALIRYPLGVFVDGKLIAAPRISRAITNGNPVISGFDAHEAHLLVAELNSGPLPVPVSEVTSPSP